MNFESQPDTRVISARIPAAEALRVDELAQAAGLSRNDFIRMRLKAESLFVDVEELFQLIDVLRQVEKALDSYINQLERLLVIADDSQHSEEVLALIIDEIANAEALMNLVFKTQRETVRVVRVIREKVDAPF